MKSRFVYHPECEEVGLINMIFADVIFIMSSVDRSSLHCVKLVIVEFGEMSGLRLNLEKGNIFVAGADEGMNQYWASILSLPDSMWDEIEALMRQFL
ncbi:hypothetical protein LIER_36734 [Lithospermum erythrorhizon]|uniref:Uncharacterized protein n=1 Tax=Lithospermum erythrorhizon TaxID=34254 RepID=A0AAV3PA24_LITER